MRPRGLRWIKACMVRRGFAFRLCGGRADFNTYRALRLPVVMWHSVVLQPGQQLPPHRGSRPADLLALQRDDFPRRALLDTIRSPFFNLSAFGFKPGDGKSLEIASRWGQVIEDIECWQKTLQRLLKITRAEDGRKLQMEDEENETSSPSLPRHETAGRLKQSLEKLAGRLRPTGGRHPLRRGEWLTTCS